MSNNPVVVGLGEILWDRLPGGKQLGGAPANFAYHARALGAKAGVVSCVGDDAAGAEIAARLDALKLDRSCLAVDPAHPTGSVEVRLDAAGKPQYVIRREVAWDYIPVSDRLIAQARRSAAVCFGSLCQRAPVSRETIRAFLAATPPACLRVFDVNLRQSFFSRKIIRESLQLANVLKISDEELPVVADLLHLPDHEAALTGKLLGEYDLRLMAVTKGARGSALFTAGEVCRHPGISVKVADTVGAGDAFTAALIMGLLNGLGLKTISVMANRLAAYVCSRSGATPKIPREIIRMPNVKR